MAEQVKKSSSSGSLTSWMTTSSATSTTGNSDKMNDSWSKNRGITTPFKIHKEGNQILSNRQIRRRKLFHHHNGATRNIEPD
jgi:hypothetical protein